MGNILTDFDSICEELFPCCHTCKNCGKKRNIHKNGVCPIVQQTQNVAKQEWFDYNPPDIPIKSKSVDASSTYPEPDTEIEEQKPKTLPFPTETICRVPPNIIFKPESTIRNNVYDSNLDKINEPMNNYLQIPTINKNESGSEFSSGWSELSNDN